MIVKFVQLIVLALNYVPGNVNKEYNGKQNIWKSPQSWTLQYERDLQSDNKVWKVVI